MHKIDTALSPPCYGMMCKGTPAAPHGTLTPTPPADPPLLEIRNNYPLFCSVWSNRVVEGHFPNLCHIYLPNMCKQNVFSNVNVCSEFTNLS